MLASCHDVPRSPLEICLCLNKDVNLFCNFSEARGAGGEGSWELVRWSQAGPRAERRLWRDLLIIIIIFLKVGRRRVLGSQRRDWAGAYRLAPAHVAHEVSAALAWAGLVAPLWSHQSQHSSH